MDQDDAADLRDSATLHAVRGEMACIAGPLLTRLSRDPLGDPQTATELRSLAQLMASERAEMGRAARTRLSATLAGGDLT